MTTDSDSTLTTDCEDHHRRLWDDVIRPKTHLLIFSILGGGITTAVFVLMFIISAKVQEHELRDRDQMISRREFEATVSRIESKVEKMSDTITEALDDLALKVERNHNAIVRSGINQAPTR